MKIIDCENCKNQSADGSCSKYEGDVFEALAKCVASEIKGETKSSNDSSKKKLNKKVKADNERSESLTLGIKFVDTCEAKSLECDIEGCYNMSKLITALAAICGQIIADNIKEIEELDYTEESANNIMGLQFKTTSKELFFEFVCDKLREKIDKLPALVEHFFNEK